MRQLEELNLVDNFLANSLTSHKLYGESAGKLTAVIAIHGAHHERECRDGGLTKAARNGYGCEDGWRGRACVYEIF